MMSHARDKLIAVDWLFGMTLRAIAKRHDVSEICVRVILYEQARLLVYRKAKDDLPSLVVTTIMVYANSIATGIA